MILTKRDAAEWDLAHALDRHIGYTTGAFGLRRIAGVALICMGRTTILDVEIVNRLTKKHGVKEDYAKGILDFAVGLGLLERFGSVGTATRVGLTGLGRSYCGAYHCQNDLLQSLILTYAVLASDCDLYGLLLDSFLCNTGEENAAQQLAKELQTLRRKRLEWLQTYLPNATLRRRVTDKVSWLRKGRGDIDSVDTRVAKDFARHHSVPRKKWARALGHIHDHGEATPFGKEIRNKICGDDGSYFWLGPNPNTLEDLRLPKQAERKPLGPVWSLLRPTSPQEAPVEKVSYLAAYMEEAYPAIRLVHSNQASTETVLPFLYLQEREAGVRYDENEVLRRIFSEYPNRFAPMSKRSRLIGHYQIRKK